VISSVVKRALGLVVLSLFAAGCEEEPPPPPLSEVIEVRNGTWMTTRAVAYAGPSLCDSLAEGPVDSTQILCHINPGEGAGIRFRFTCDVDQEGEDVAYTCTSDFNEGPCLVQWTLTGGGTVTDTTFSLTGSLVTVVLGDSATCAEFAFPCTSTVTLTGTYLSDAGADSVCGGLLGLQGPGLFRPSGGP